MMTTARVPERPSTVVDKIYPLVRASSQIFSESVNLSKEDSIGNPKEIQLECAKIGILLLSTLLTLIENDSVGEQPNGFNDKIVTTCSSQYNSKMTVAPEKPPPVTLDKVYCVELTLQTFQAFQHLITSLSRVLTMGVLSKETASSEKESNSINSNNLEIMQATIDLLSCNIVALVNAPKDIKNEENDRLLYKEDSLSKDYSENLPSQHHSNDVDVAEANSQQDSKHNVVELQSDSDDGEKVQAEAVFLEEQHKQQGNDQTTNDIMNLNAENYLTRGDRSDSYASFDSLDSAGMIADMKDEFRTGLVFQF